LQYYFITRDDKRAPIQWTGYKVEPLYTYFLDLAKGEGKIWADFNGNLRQSIKATENKVTVREGTKDDLDALYALVFERFKQAEFEYRCF